MSQARLVRYLILAVVCGGAYVGLRNVPVLLSQESPKPVAVEPRIQTFDLTPRTQNVAVGGGLRLDPEPAAGLPGASGPGDSGGGAAGAAGGPGAGPAGGGGPPPGVAPTGLADPSSDRLIPVPVGAPPTTLSPSIMSIPGMPSGMMSMSPDKLEELKSAQQAKALLNQYGKEQTPDGREKIKAEIRNHLLRQFKIQHGRRASELEAVERRLAELRAKLKKRWDAQATIVDRRLEQLISDIDGLGWNTDEIPDNLFLDSLALPSGSSGAMGSGYPGIPGMAPGATPATVYEAQPGAGFLPRPVTVPPAKGPGGSASPTPAVPSVPGGPLVPATIDPAPQPKTDDLKPKQEPAALPGAPGGGGGLPIPTGTTPTPPAATNDVEPPKN